MMYRAYFIVIQQKNTGYPAYSPSVFPPGGHKKSPGTCLGLLPEI